MILNSFIENLYVILKSVSDNFFNILFILSLYKVVYFIIGVFHSRNFKETNTKHKYGICIAARNEEKVIGNLLDSINKQDYGRSNFDVFVVSDNSTDKTAEIARKYGAIVYEHNDPNERTKGFALRYLFKCIERDYKIKSYDAYFIFDADNLLAKDYITRMNESFDSGCKVVTSYRNTKNLGDGWISSGYAIHWFRSIINDHRARSVLHLATNIQGTGFLVDSEILKDGWNYTSITEDRELTADLVSNGYEISYNDKAMFYDEQPTTLKVAFRQRLRWSRGHLLAFFKTGPKLFLNIFKGTKNNKKGFKNRFTEEVRSRFASLDMLLLMIPQSVLSFFSFILITLLLGSIKAYNIGYDITITGNDIIGQILYMFFGEIKYSFNSGINAMLYFILISILIRLFNNITNYISSMVVAIYVFILHRKRMVKISLGKKIKYILLWPLFDIIGKITAYITVFMKVEWKPIIHDSNKTIDDISK